ncbi:hypothetical protein FQZ97_892690 [compost metagenome]
MLGARCQERFHVLLHGFLASHQMLKSDAGKDIARRYEPEIGRKPRYATFGEIVHDYFGLAYLGSTNGGSDLAFCGWRLVPHRHNPAVLSRRYIHKVRREKISAIGCFIRFRSCQLLASAPASQIGKRALQIPEGSIIRLSSRVVTTLQSPVKRDFCLLNSHLLAPWVPS